MSDCSKNIYYVYTHTRLDTNQVFYIGKGKKSRAYSTHGRNKYWKNIVNKTPYIVKIIADNLCEDMSLELEVFVISEYKTLGVKLVNMTDGGEGVSGLKDTEETKRKKSIRATGRKMSVESIQKSREKNKGRVSSRKGVILTEEQKTKISIANTGKSPSMEARQKMSQVSKGKKKSDEHRKNMKLAKQNISQETINKMRESARIREEKKKQSRGCDV
jgi:hypothetical protein